ncbi:MAG: AraC family transcriptional regulator ligand-binding domain-containing protein [Solirubrobacterales bacterium]
MIGTLKNWARLVERALAAEGVSLADELVARGVAIDLEDAARITGREAHAIWTCAEQTTRSDSFGIDVVRLTQYEDFEELGVALAVGGSLESMADRMANYHHLLTDGMDVDARHGDGELCIEITSGPRTHPLVHEFGAALITRVVRARFGGAVNPSRVEIAMEHSRGAHEYPRYFRCPISLGGAVTRVAFDESFANATRAVGRPRISDRLEQMLADEVQAITRNALWSSKVSDQLPAMFDAGTLTLEQVAKNLHVSERSLQRQLAGEGVTFRELVTQARKELAGRWVADERYSIGEIAYLLGFASTSSFSRAYKRWYGVAPSAHLGGA